MSFFVDEFAFSADSAFRVILSADAKGFRVGGTFGADGGLVAALDADGHTLWQKTYLISGRVVRFWSGVLCDNGDLLLHGSLPVGTDRSEALLVRLTPDGDLRWANSYTRDKTRINIRLIKGRGDTYTFAGWYNETGTTDDVEAVRIDGNGNVLAAVNIHTSGDDQLNSLLPFFSASTQSILGCILVGGSDVGGTWDSFAIFLDDNLQPVWKRTFGGGQFDQAQAIVQIGFQFFIAGETGDDRKTFIAKFAQTDTTVNAKVFAFQPGAALSGHRLLQIGGLIFLSANVSTTPPTSFVAAFDTNLNLLWQRSLAPPGNVFLFDLAQAVPGDNLLLTGTVTRAGNVAASLLACTDAQLASCVTKNLTPPKPADVAFKASDWPADVTQVKVTVTKQAVLVRTLNLVPAEICPPGVSVDLEGARVQSPYIYLQAAGSDGTDQTVRGFHLRWDLLRRLGQTHLPKGNLAAPGGPWPTTIGFNRADDFVRIYRTELRDAFGVTVDLTKPPSMLAESGTAREWVYEDLVPSPGRTTDVSIHFLDTAQYDKARQSNDPHTVPQQFLSAYKGLIDVRAVAKLAFSVSFGIAPFNDPTVAKQLRVEALTLPDPLDNGSRAVGFRGVITPANNAPVIGENIESVRFDYAGVALLSLHIATYDDFLSTASARQLWQKLGDFSLDDGNADADANVFRRLEDPPKFSIDNRWPKFQGAAAPGLFRVKAQNYRDRWRMTDGLKKGVATYLDVSRTDVSASVVTHNADRVANDSAVELSYLDILNFVSLDFHVARMLGLGAIDPNATVTDATRFIYLMQYVTEAQLAHETPKRVVHCWMTPPVRISDQKFPPSPELDLTFGLPPEECEGVTTPLTDADGYATFDQIRFVNLNRKPFRYELPMEPFFQSGTLFSLFDQTVPVSYGVGYGPGPAGAGNDVRPELSNNPDWKDPSGIAEVAQIPERGVNPVYTHQERSAGVHHYRLYSINWFSRTRGASNEVQTDATHFAPRNTLLPPSNLAVQLIQKEDPRIFTSTAEQTRLAQLPAGDKTLLRVTFDWNYVQNRAYFGADKVEIYFRTAPRAVVRGEIASVAEDVVAHTATIVTKPYLIASSDPAVTVQPQIAAADMARFVGGTLTINGDSWLVQSVVSIGANPTLLLKQLRTTASVDADQNNNFCTVEMWRSPRAGDRFLLAENLDNPAVWDTKLTKEVALAKFLPPFTEHIVNNDGKTRDATTGGFTAFADVQEIPDPDPNLHALVPPGAPASVPSGAYTVRFPNQHLPAIADPDVEFHEGIVRLLDVTGKFKVLRVWNIAQSGPDLVLTVYDSEFGLKRDTNTGMFVLDNFHRFVTVDGVAAVQTSLQNVNFHPSYRVYLRADLALGHNFGEPALLPAAGESTRQTLLTVRARDTVAGLTSPMARPAVILAIEQHEPAAPGPLLGPLFATRPNFFGKASYTVDVQVGDPHSLIFYKANERKILDQLYAPATARAIAEQLDALSDQEKAFTTQRWHDLLEVITDSSGAFKSYTPQGFRFPTPDNDAYVIADPALQPPVTPFANNTTPPGSGAAVPGAGGRTMKDIVREAVAAAFVPITELPLVYRQLTDKTLQTSARPPKLRDAQGHRLAPNDADPWPMAVRFEKNAAGNQLQFGSAGYGSAANTRWVRVTDYTLDGASKNLYFYFAVELSNTMKVSARSAITGPVQLVNAAPAEAPVIRKITARLADGAGLETRVNFTLGNYLPSDGVTSFRLYRALDAAAAMSVRSMTEVAEFPAGAPEIFDDFTGLADIPFGDPIFYRVVAFRRILNERGDAEDIPSKPSAVATTRVADAVNPAPPPITISSDPITTTHPQQYNNVVLSWPRTTSSGTYTLYKLSDAGTWVRIGSTKSNAAVISMSLAQTTLGTGVLIKEDAAGNPIYHRFHVMVENASGLLNLTRKELII